MDPVQNTSASAQMPTQAQPNIATAHYAGFWVRFVAAIIDGIILGIVVGVISFLLHVSPHADYPIRALFAWLYYAYMESSSKQATFGKQALNLKVTDMNGAQISFAHATGRYFAKILSAIILFFGFFMIGWTEKKQGLHDIIAKTLVVKK